MSASTASQPYAIDRVNRRLAAGLLLSMALHALLLLLQFGVPGVGPAVMEPLRLVLELARAPEPELPAPVSSDGAVAVVQAPAVPVVPAAVGGFHLVAPRPHQAAPAAATRRPRAARRISAKSRRRARLHERVIVQEHPIEPTFAVPLPEIAPALEKSADPMALQDGAEDGQGSVAAKEERPLARDEVGAAMPTPTVADATSAQPIPAPQQRDVAEGSAADERERQLAEQAQARIEQEHQAQEQARKLAEVQAERQIAEEQARQQAAEQARQRVADELVRQQAAELARQRVAGDLARRQAEQAQQDVAEELARQQAAEQARQRVAEEVARQQAEQARRDVAEELARQQAAEQARQRVAEEHERWRAAEQARQRVAEELERQQAEQARQRVADELARQQAEQARQRAAEELARQQAEQAQQRAAEELARQQAELARQRLAAAVRSGGQSAQPEPALARGPGTGPGLGGNGTAASGSRGLSGDALASRARQLLRGLDVLKGAPPEAARTAEPQRADRRIVASGTERDLPLRFYVDSFRQKIERNGTLNRAQLSAQRVRIDPVVSVALRSDGSVADVLILRSSGHPDTDEAVRRIVRLNERFAAFPPNVAARFDVIEIRRIWVFAEGLKLLEEVR
jgi:TonB family protein